MKKNLKEDILNTGIRLFFENGYNNTSVRQIAAACDIAVGNLNYYYPKKEDIIMDYHNKLMTFFTDGLQEQLSHSNPWINYFAAEYSFIHYIANDIPTRHLYKEVVNVPSLRDSYYEKHHELFLNYMKEEPQEDTEDAYLATTAMCSLEFFIIEQYDRFPHEWELDDLMYHIFESRLVFSHREPKAYRDVIQQGIEKGRLLKDLHYSSAFNEE